MFPQKTKKIEMEIMHEVAELVSKTLGEIARFIEKGISTEKLNKIAHTYISRQGAEPSFIQKGFPGAISTAVNNFAVHTKPSSYVLKEGDIITIDCGVFYKKHHGDAAYTFSVGNIDSELVDLLACTKEALYQGIGSISSSTRWGGVGSTIESYVKKRNFNIVKDYGGHAIGLELHEPPFIPHTGRKGVGKKIENDRVYCLEPIVKKGNADVKQINDWDVVAVDGQPVAHFEHMIKVIDRHPVQLTTFEYIDKTDKRRYE